MPAPLIESSATLSPCGRYRYALARIWDTSAEPALFIGLNPSIADATDDDPTIRRCVDYARRWGCGGLLMGNLFAWRSTDPSVLTSVPDPVGPDNDRHLLALAKRAQVRVAAWGNDGHLRGRGMQVRTMVPELAYLKCNKSGQPAHPLYLAAHLTPQRFQSQ